MLLSIITLPENFNTNIVANASTMFTDLAPYISLIVGVMLAAVVVELVIGAFRK
jgi:hypothetical protein